MTQTTNYDLNIVEGSDVVNPLVQTNPNFTKIDEVMKANEIRGIATSTEVKSGTNHAITRNVANAVFRFVATSDFRTGDTFSVDGTTVTATLVDGTLPKDRAFVVGTSVLCILDGIRLTFVNCESSPTDINASDVNYDNTESGLDGTKVQSAIDEIAEIIDIIKSNIDTNDIRTEVTPVTYSYLRALQISKNAWVVYASLYKHVDTANVFADSGLALDFTDKTNVSVVLGKTVVTPFDGHGSTINNNISVCLTLRNESGVIHLDYSCSAGNLEFNTNATSFVGIIIAK